MGLLDSLFGNLFGGGGKQASPDWGQIEKLMKLETELNRTNRQGIFGGWDWSENPDGTWTQNQNLAPGMQPGADRLMARAAGGQGFGNYQQPEQMSQMLDALMATQMDRMNIGQGKQTPEQAGFGPSSASQFAAQNPPPPQPPPQQAPPQQAPPQGGMGNAPIQGGGGQNYGPGMGQGRQGFERPWGDQGRDPRDMWDQLSRLGR